MTAVADGMTPARTPAGLPAGVWLAVLAVLAIAAVAAVAPYVAPYDPLNQDLMSINAPPSAEHWLGVDHVGRDVLSRLITGARVTFEVGLGGVLIAFFVGAAVGLAALATSRISEVVVFGFIDLVRAMPGTLLALLLIVALGSGTGPVTVALGISFAPLFAYVARAAYKREMAQDYVRAARIFGGSRLHILTRHVLPNIAGALVTQAAIILPRCVVSESVLSFLGLGSSPDAPSWGRMISDSSRFIEAAPHAILPPVLALIVLTVGLSVIGGVLRIRLDPLRSGRSPTPAEAHP